PVPLVEGVRRGEGDIDAVEPGRGEALPAALVEDEPRQLDTVPPRDLLDDLLRPGHLRDALVAHEADGLDPAQPGRREPVDELGARLRREHLRLVLEPVARHDVAYEDPHGGERSAYGYGYRVLRLAWNRAPVRILQRRD